MHLHKHAHTYTQTYTCTHTHALTYVHRQTHAHTHSHTQSPGHYGIFIAVSPDTEAPGTPDSLLLLPYLSFCVLYLAH